MAKPPTSRHRKRALAPWRNQRVQCVAVGVCCTRFLENGVFAQVHGRWRTSQCRPAPRVVDGHSEQGGPPSAMRSACSRVYGDFVSAGVLHLNAALLLSHSRILRGALRTTSGGEPASISTALPYSRLSPHGCPSLLRWPSYLHPNGSIQADVRRVRRRVLREVPSGMR